MLGLHPPFPFACLHGQHCNKKCWYQLQFPHWQILPSTSHQSRQYIEGVEKIEVPEDQRRKVCSRPHPSTQVSRKDLSPSEQVAGLRRTTATGCPHTVTGRAGTQLTYAPWCPRRCATGQEVGHFTCCIGTFERAPAPSEAVAKALLQQSP